jgi:hypothetical protein
MIFEKITKRAEVLNEARTSRFETLFQTGYLRKAIEDKKLGVARPIMFKFIIEFLQEKGLVPEGTAFAGARYAAEAGEFIKNLVDSGVVKDEIADEFRQYTQDKLGQFLARLQQVRTRGKGEMVGKTFGSKDDFQQFKTVKTAEELKAEREAKKLEGKQQKQSAADDISPTSSFTADTSIIEIVWGEDLPIDVQKLNTYLTKVNGGNAPELDAGENSADFEFSGDSIITQTIKKAGAEKVEKSLKQTLSKVLGIDTVDFEVIVHAPGEFDFGGAEEKPKTFSQKAGVDDQGYGMGSFGQPDEQRFEDEEEPVKESYKKKEVKFVTNRDLYKPKTIWQQIQLQNEQFRI